MMGAALDKIQRIRCIWLNYLHRFWFDVSTLHLIYIEQSYESLNAHQCNTSNGSGWWFKDLYTYEQVFFACFHFYFRIPIPKSYQKPTIANNRIRRRNQQTNCIFSEPRCGPIGASISLSLPQCDIDVPQPIIDRRPSMSLFKWGGSQKRNDAPTPTAARQGLISINSK